MGCVFCASGADGFGRNLSAGEIAGQVIAVNRDLGGTARDRKINNIVLMGSGEPLDNYDNVVQFLRIIMAKEGLNMGQRCISLSTCGLAERIKRLADDGFSVNLTVSLHAVTDEARSAIMPVNKSNPIAAVMSAARYYFERTGRRIMFEYTLIKGRNSGAADARRLALLLRGISAHVNLILLNPGTDGGLQPLSRDEAETFKGRLEALGVNCTVRRALGSDIEGACGQLKRRYTART
jgi:23S rRNA (adenine2503-C2)-methyltransferase